MAFIPLSSNQVDAKSPVDDLLMTMIKDDLDYLYGVVATGGFPLTWELMGNLEMLRYEKGAVGAAPAANVFTPSSMKLTLKRSGISGNLKFDLRRLITKSIPIVGISHQFDGLTQSIGNVAPALATQSITRTTPQISTQSITHAKGTINILSIVKVLGTNKWRLNLDATPDADYIAGASVTVAGATSGGNNATVVISEVNQGGGANLVVTNASGVAQAAASGTIQLKLMSYNQTNPINADFVPGESALFASHTAGANNGTLQIAKINQSGNNIWVYNATGVTQGTAAGTVDVQRFIFAFTVAADANDFAVGERAKTASHSNAANNGNFPIIRVNSGGNNLVLYIAAGVVQGGVAGNVNTNRWTYSLSTDPSTDVSVGYGLQMESHTNALNNGVFPCVMVKRSGLNNVVVYNEAGVAQASTPGTVRTTRKLVKFGSDQSADLSVGAFLDISECPAYTSYNTSKALAPFEILQVNRGGGANYNAVIDPMISNPSQDGAAGFVSGVQYSLCNTPITIPATALSLAENQDQVVLFTDFKSGAVTAGTMVGLFATELMIGAPQDLTAVLQ